MFKTLLAAITILSIMTFTSVGLGAELKVGLVLDKGGKDDKSFN
ncbi:MAG: BMP family ABC transporter substrate-binding protein, partial [Proteobacteria bacterium]